MTSYIATFCVGRNTKFENTQLVPQVKVPPGPQGVNGAPGAKGGIVYVRWGHDSCPDGGAQLVYAGRAGGSYHTHKGGGGNPQCLPLDPEYHQRQGATYFGYMYGAEYENTDGLVVNSHDTDVPCAVCHVPTRNTVYMLPAKYSCPEGWTREYFGHLMSEHHSHHRSDFSCVDYSLTPVIGSKFDHNGFLFYAVRGACGSLPCPNYIQDKELSCAVCTK